MAGVIGGAMLPHAPQFFTMPDSEDRGIVARVKQAAAEIGARLKAQEPDLWIIFANDHAEQFFLTAAPPFTVHVGAEASGAFAGREFHWRVAGEIGFEIVRQLYAQGFDPAFTSVARIDYALGIPLTHLEVSDPVLPIYVNAYLPPQPTMQRCYAFGEALARIVTAMGLCSRDARRAQTRPRLVRAELASQLCLARLVQPAAAPAGAALSGDPARTRRTRPGAAGAGP